MINDPDISIIIFCIPREAIANSITEESRSTRSFNGSRISPGETDTKPILRDTL